MTTTITVIIVIPEITIRATATMVPPAMIVGFGPPLFSALPCPTVLLEVESSLLVLDVDIEVVVSVLVVSLVLPIGAEVVCVIEDVDIEVVVSVNVVVSLDNVLAIGTEVVCVVEDADIEVVVSVNVVVSLVLGTDVLCVVDAVRCGHCSCRRSSVVLWECRNLHHANLISKL